MKKILSFTTVLLFLAGSLAWSQPPADAVYDQGRKVFNSSCRMCHIWKAEGDQPSPYYLRFRPTDFAEADFWKRRDDKKIEDTIRNGKGTMPAQRISGEEMKAVIHFLKAEFKK